MTEDTESIASRIFRLVLLLTPGLFSLSVGIFIWSADPELRTQYIPDDAFYYLTLARNFTESGTWSFDLGVSATTGFHILHAYWLAWIDRIFDPSTEVFVLISGVATWLVAAAAFSLGGFAAWRTRSLPAALLFAVMMLSRNVTLNAIATMEWSWVVVISVSYLLLLDRIGSSRPGVTTFLLLLSGFLGSLARSDFGLMPAAMATACLLIPRLSGKRAAVIGTLAGLAGAGLGVAAVTLHNYLVSGSLVQSSALMKYHWLRFAGPTPIPILRSVLYMFGMPSVMSALLVTVCMVIILILGFLLLRRNVTWERDCGPNRCMIWLGCVLTFGGYAVFFSFNSLGIQHWYTAHLAVPIFTMGIIPMMSAETPDTLRSGLPRLLNTLLTATLIVMLIIQVWNAVAFFSRPEWPFQRNLYHAAQYLKTAQYEGRVGSWNAGILGYYTGRGVVNIDGLVNNGIYAYASTNNLPRYLDSVSIGYLVDFEAMISREDLRARGGYDRVDFLQRLDPLKRFDEDTVGWTRVTLWKIAPAR